MAANYDTVLILHLYSPSSFTSPNIYRDQLLSIAASTKSRLLIYLPTTPLWQRLYGSRTGHAVFDRVQTLLADLYVLAGSKLDLLDGKGVDVLWQVLRDGDPSSSPGTGMSEPFDLESIKARASTVSEVSDRDSGERGSNEAAISSANGGEEGSGSLPTVALGGTFDHLHPGHQILLTMACWLASRRVIVGITDDILLSNKSDRDLLESLQERTNKARSFLNAVAPSIQHDLPALQDVFGPTATDPDIQGLLVSEETRKGASAIAEKRAKDGLSTLELYVIKVISAEEVLPKEMDKNELARCKMGSTAIRRGLRERRGGG